MKSCLFLNEIPDIYFKDYSVYKRGVTSIVLEHNYKTDHVLMFTRDNIKSEWLQTQDCHIDFIDNYFSEKHRNKLLWDYQISVLKLKKLKKVLAKEINKLTKDVQSIIYDSVIKQRNIQLPDASIVALVKAIDHISEDHELYDYFQFISNYNDWIFDFKRDSILQDDKQNKYIIDLVLPYPLVKVIHQM
jgi:hypothetical protein